MIHISCSDRYLRAEVRRALSRTFEFEFVGGDLNALFLKFDGETTSAFVVCLESDVRSTGKTVAQLASLRDWSSTSLPVVLISESGQIERSFSDERMRGIRNVVVSVDDVAELLEEAILQEVARTALADVAALVRTRSVLPDALRMSLGALLNDECTCCSVKQLATLAKCHAGTLRRQWRGSVSSDDRLKNFLDLSMLLRARSRKSARLTWRDIAAEYEKSVRHFYDTAIRTMGSWPRAHEGEKWLHLAARFRAEGSSLFSSTQ